jgi:hypothetical protein
MNIIKLGSFALLLSAAAVSCSIGYDPGSLSSAQSSKAGGEAGSGSGGTDTASTGAGGSSDSTGGAGGMAGAGGAGISGANTAGGAGGANAAGSSGKAGSAGNGGNIVFDGGSDGNRSADAVADARGDASLDAAAADTGCADPIICTLKTSMLHRYSFAGTGTQVMDSIGTADGTVMNAQLSGKGTVVLSGGGTDQYVSLPAGIVRQLTNATLEVWLTWDGGGPWQRIFDFGDSDQKAGLQGQAVSNLYVTPQAMPAAAFPGPWVMTAGFKRAEQMPIDELHLVAAKALVTGALVQLALVIDADNHQMSLYRNGAKETSTSFVGSLSTLNDVNNWLGRSQYADDPSLGATLHEFRIFGAALSLAALQASFTAGPDAVF